MDLSYERVKYIVSVLARCDDKSASEVANKVCASPEAMAVLAVACNSTADLAAAGTGVTVGAAMLGAAPVVLGTATFSAVSYKAAKRFCQAMVRYGAAPVRQVSVDVFQGDMKLP